MLRVGFGEDGSWRLFGLRHDFNPAVKVQTEDDITASVVVDGHMVGLPTGRSYKLVENCEELLFQRPDDAIHRGYDKQAEADIAGPGTFLSNFQPLTRDDAIEMRDDAVAFSAFTAPMANLISAVAESPEGSSPAFFVSSANPRIVDGKPSKNPRYLQKRPDRTNAAATAVADLAAHLVRRLPSHAALPLPVDVVAAGRRNNPPDGPVPPLCSFSPLHFMELPELFMEFISSMTGKSPSTTGAGSEGAMTKGPFNALPAIIDLNAALLSYALTGYDGWVSCAGYVGPKFRVEHDISMLVPEVFSRMTATERTAANLYTEGALEKIEDFEHNGQPVLASRLGYRMTQAFARKYFGRIFLHPHAVFTEEMLRPELQDLDVFAESMATMVTTHQRVAQAYFDDETIALAIPPLRALLEIMANGQTAEGWDLDSPGLPCAVHPAVDRRLGLVRRPAGRQAGSCGHPRRRRARGAAAVQHDARQRGADPTARRGDTDQGCRGRVRPVQQPRVPHRHRRDGRSSAPLRRENDPVTTQDAAAGPSSVLGPRRVPRRDSSAPRRSAPGCIVVSLGTMAAGPDEARATLDGNEAAALVAHALSEVIAIYPITPSSAMGESADAWSAAGKPNLWGGVPEVIELQSEAGAAGALHGAVTKGTLGTTFTASQGLLLMLPNMFKIAGELTPAVIHVAARTVATHALSIFGDHSDVMTARMTGWAMLAASSVQEAHDFALVAHAATLRSRVPFVHFFDGFRTSHEVNTIELLGDADLRALVREDDVLAHRARGLTPDAPMIRGVAENPDTFFQAAEAANPFHFAVPETVSQVFDELAARTGRRYSLVDYHGAPDAERVVVAMGSSAGCLAETVDELVRRGEKVGMLTVRLYRPFPVEAFLAALPPTVTGIAVLDRTKEVGAPAEPLHADVLVALSQTVPEERAQRASRRAAHHPGHRGTLRPVLQGVHPRDGEGGVRRADRRPTPSRASPSASSTTSRTSRSRPTTTSACPTTTSSAVFFGLGSDGTVGAAKNSVKIIGEQPDAHAQGYFVYDSRKSGAVTVSHLRFGKLADHGHVPRRTGGLRRRPPVRPAHRHEDRRHRQARRHAAAELARTAPTPGTTCRWRCRRRSPTRSCAPG